MASIYLEKLLGAILLKRINIMAVNIRVNADTSKARQDLSKLENSVKSIDKTTKNVTRSLTRLAQGIATAFGGAVAIKSINGATNSLIELENRTALVTGRNEQLGKSLNNLYSIARQSRQSVGLAAETFNRFGLALKGTGTSVTEIEKATLSVQRALSISGGSAESASAAIFQLGQGLASGTLRGQELNSVLEQAPRIALAIADSLGVAQGELRAMAAEGQLTTEVVFSALLGQSEKLEKEFAVLEQTSTQAFTVMSDSIKRVVGEISRGIGFTDVFTRSFNRITDVFVNSGSGFEIGIYAKIAELQTLVSDLTPLFQAVGRVVTAFGGRVGNAIQQAILPLRTVGDKLYISFLKPILAIEQRLRSFKLGIAAAQDSATYGGSRGGITNLFKAESLNEAILALDTIAEQIENTGRRTYNIFAKSENAIRPFLISIETVGIKLGLIDQSLLRLRSNSMEDFNFILRLTVDLLDEVYRNILALKSIRVIIIAFTELKQGVKRVLEALQNDVKKIFNSIALLSTGLFGNVFDKATESLSKTAKVVTKYLKQIERAFFWVYDEVIANSWWTDLMEETYILSVKWLGKTSSVVSNFSNSIVSSFSNAYNKAMPKIKDLFSAVSSKFKKIEINIDAKAEFSSILKDPVDYLQKSLRSLFVGIGKPIGKAISEAYKEVREIAPFLTSILTAIFGTKLVGLVSTSVAAGLSQVIRGGVIAALALTLIDAFGDSLLDSGAIGDFAKGVGAAAGTFLNFFIANIPEIIRALSQAAVSFGQGLADSVSGIPGIILKGLMSIPFFNILPGLLAAGVTSYFTGFGPSKLIKNFISGRQKLFDDDAKVLSKKASKLAGSLSSASPRISFFESALIGRGSGRATLAKFTSGILIADTLLRGVFGDTALVDIISAGGFVVSLLYGTKGYSAVISQLQGAFSVLKSVMSSSLATKSTAPFAGALIDSASLIAEKFQFSMYAVGRGVSALGLRLGILSTQAKTAGSDLSLNMAGPFQDALYRMGLSLGKFTRRMSRFTKGALIGGLALLFASMGSSAEAATNDAADATVGMLDKIVNSIESVINHPLGIIGLMMFGGKLGSVVLSAVGAIGAAAGAKLGSSLLKSVGKFSAVRGGMLALAILGEGSFAAGIGSALSAAAAAIGSFLAGLAGLALAVAAGIGLIGIAFFGEGDTISERFGNAYDSARKFFGYSSRAARDLEASLVKSLGSFDKIGDMNVNFNDIFDTFSFEDINIKESKELQTIAKRTNSILETAQRNLEENGVNSRYETRRVKRAVDAARQAFIDSNKPQIDGVEQSSASKTLTTLLAPFENIFKDNISFVPQSAEITRGLGLPTAASEGLSSAFEEISNSIATGDDFQITSAIAALLNDSNLVEELNKSISGSTLISSLNSIMAVSSGMNADNVSPEVMNSLFTSLSELGKEFESASGITGTGISIRQELADKLLAAVSGDVNQVIQTTQGVVRSAAEDSFLQAATALQSVFGEGIFDASAFDSQDLVKLSTEDLRDLTKTMLGKASKATEQLNRFENIDQNLVTTEERSKVFDQVQTNIKLLFEAMTNKMGLAGDTIPEVVVAAFDRMNARLEKLGIDALNLVPSSNITTPGLTNSSGRDVETVNKKILSQLIEIELLQDSINDANQKDNTLRNQQLVSLGRAKSLLEVLIAEENSMTLAQVDRIGAIENALSQVENSKSLEEAISINPNTMTEILRASGTIDFLTAALTRLQLVGNGQVDVGIIRVMERKVSDARDLVSSFLSNDRGPGKPDKPDKASKKDKVNPFEQFVTGLGEAGFGFNLQEAAGLGSAAFEKLKKPVSEVLALNKKITESTLDDVKGRSAAVAELEKQKKLIFETLIAQGTVLQGNKALEALGLDESVGTSQRTLDIGKNILVLQEKLSTLSFDDYKNKSETNRELEYQTTLLNNLTSKAQSASDSIRSAFAESFKSLIKGESTIAGFFNSLLDSISNSIIDTVVDSFTQAFFRASNLDVMFDTFFSSLMGSADGVGNLAGGKIKEGIGSQMESMGEGGFLSGLSEGFTGVVSMLGKGLSSIFEGLSGMFSGGGGFLSSILGAFSGAPLHTGGIVQMRSAGGLINPNIGQAGKDSVPVMLTPGEYVLPSQRTAELLKSNSGNNGSNQTVVNLSVTGDISRQTRKEIIKMMPSITQGVNSQNKESNYRR